MDSAETKQEPTVLKINEIFVAIAIEDNGDESFIGKMVPGKGLMPLMLAEAKYLEMFKKDVAEVAKTAHKKILIAKFSSREDEEVTVVN